MTKKKLKQLVVVVVIILAVIAYFITTKSNVTVNWAKKIDPQTVTSIEVLRPEEKEEVQYYQLEEKEYEKITGWLNAAKLKVGDGEALTDDNKNKENTTTITIAQADGMVCELSGLGLDHGIFINKNYYETVQDGVASLRQALDGFAYTYSSDFNKQYDAFVKEKEFTEAELAYLEEEGYTKAQIIKFTIEEFFTLLPPGNSINGVGYEKNENRDKTLAAMGIDEEKHSVLANLGYTYTDMVTLSKKELGFIFPNTQMIEKLKKYEMDAMAVDAALKEGKSFKTLIKQALQKDKYTAEFVAKMKEMGITNVMLATLYQRGYTENTLLIMSAQSVDSVKTAAIPGSTKDGEEIAYIPNSANGEKLAQIGVGEYEYKVLYRLGYTAEEMLEISQEELELVLPNGEILLKLNNVGVSEDMVTEMLERGLTFKDIIKKALGK